MIREFNINDKAQLIDIVRQDIMIGDEDINFVVDNSNKIIVYDNGQGGILGFSTFRIWGKDKNKADIYTYVATASRRKGIGTLLYREIIKNADSRKLQFVSSRMKEDKANAFYEKMGYKKWYVGLDLYYDGAKQPESDLNFVNYEDKHFTQYAEGLRASFYDMRKANDFEPYLCCELSEEKRKEFQSVKDNLFLLFDNKELIASVIVFNNGNIGDVFVTTPYQGKGYGKKVMWFAINKAMEKGNSHPALDAIDWNVRALNLYQSLGFKIKQATDYYRLFLQ
ncbi:MAG: GNAT family N-acetyltransferase [Clostridiaceae bacterium]|nr:GNAT family N-acetyltransferase [Clostridiaceae bacterium]